MPAHNRAQPHVCGAVWPLPPAFANDISISYIKFPRARGRREHAHFFMIFNSFIIAQRSGSSRSRRSKQRNQRQDVRAYYTAHFWGYAAALLMQMSPPICVVHMRNLLFAIQIYIFIQMQTRLYLPPRVFCCCCACVCGCVCARGKDGLIDLMLCCVGIAPGLLAPRVSPRVARSPNTIPKQIGNNNRQL